jgi:uncharacterized membrane protein HdeD (DUF308 family)
MEDRAKGMVSKGLPWSRDVRWPIIAIEAAVLTGIGGFMLIDTDTAGDIVLQLIGVVLLVTSLMLGWASLRGGEGGLGFYDTFRAGIGTTCGAIATASWWSDYIQNHAVRIILGWGLVAWSLLHVVGLIAVRGRGNIRMSTIVIVTLSVVLGIVLLTGDDTTSTDRLNLLGVILLVFGALLAALAYYLYSRNHPRVGARVGPGTAS